MGWTYYHATEYKNGKIDRKAEIDKQLTYSNGTTSQVVLKSTMVGATYYGAIKTGNEVWAAVFLTGTADDYFNFGYKDMDETEIPYRYDCPASILNLLTPTENENANTWRQACRDKIAKKKAGNTLNQAPIGTRIKWTYGLNGEYKILVKHEPAYQFRTWFWYDETRHNYISKRRVTDANAEIIAN